MRQTGWGPDGRRAAACITFDHLGEAAEIQIGALPPDTVVGAHPSVTHCLPALLAALAERSTACTFYVETWNYAHYPRALESILEHGHEIGWHGWLHEPWSKSTGSAIADSIAESLHAFERTGIRPRGARPPGGLLGDHSLDLLAQAGFDHVSLAGTRSGLQDGLALLPFAWSTVDGSYYFDSFAKLRVPPGEHAVGAPGLLAAYDRYLDETVASGGLATFVFHVPWQDQPDRVGAVVNLIDRIADDSRIWLASAGEIADWMRAHPDSVPAVQHVDELPAW